MDLKELFRRPIVKVGLVLGAIGVVVILTVFQPQKLFIDQRVDEALPGASTQATPTATPTASQAPQQATLARGSFKSLDHAGSGTALAIRLADGKRVIRFEDLNVENGPDLFVYLSTAPSNTPNENNFADDFVNLGRLKGNMGNQNYTLAASVDLARYKTVVIWCRRFTSAFAAADLA